MSVGVSEVMCNTHFSSLARRIRTRHRRNKQRRVCLRSKRSKKSLASGESVMKSCGTGLMLFLS